MGKGKLQKFAEMKAFPHVVECPFPSETERPHPLSGQWGKSFFHNDNPIVLELGCGRGEYTVELAKLFPNKNFIGIDIKGARMWGGATAAQILGLKNVGFLRTRIEFIDHFFAPNEVSEIWLTFSDPQMKKPRKRLTGSFFLERYRHFLVDEGTIHVKTDSYFLFTYTRLLAEKSNLPLTACMDDIYHQLQNTDELTRQILSIHTYYENQWLSRGIAIKYLRFNLPHEAPLLEPTEEIPLDAYRSFNRWRRTSI